MTTQSVYLDYSTLCDHYSKGLAVDDTGFLLKAMQQGPWSMEVYKIEIL